MRMTDGNTGSTVCKKRDGIRFHRRLLDPSHLTKWFGPTREGVLVLDDLMEEGGQDKLCWICLPKIPIITTSPCCILPKIISIWLILQDD